MSIAQFILLYVLMGCIPGLIPLFLGISKKRIMAGAAALVFSGIVAVTALFMMSAIGTGVFFAVVVPMGASVISAVLFSVYILKSSAQEGKHTAGSQEEPESSIPPVLEPERTISPVSPENESDRTGDKREEDYHLLKKGKKLNHRYVIQGVLGEGGFGITYIGWDELLGRKVAVKEFYPQGVVIRNNTVNDNVTVTYSGQKETFQRGKARFLSEARILARFTNVEGIVDVSDLFEANNTVYIVMEFLEGITLDKYMEMNGKLTIDDVLELSAPILNSLSEIHEMGLIHRDISPDNIMLLKKKRAKLMDFGAARDYTAKSSEGLSIILKPGYAPEEQYRTRGEQGPWTDVYAYAATIYKCITGITPDDALQRIADDSIKKPSELHVRIGRQTEAALMKALSVYREDRYQTIEDFCAELYG